MYSVFTEIPFVSHAFVRFPHGTDTPSRGLIRYGIIAPREIDERQESYYYRFPFSSAHAVVATTRNFRVNSTGTGKKPLAGKNSTGANREGHSVVIKECAHARARI